MTSEVIRCALVPVQVPIEAITAQVSALPSYWKAHLNTAHYTGDWTVLSLRAPGGNSDFIAGDSMGEAPYADTSLMDQTPGIKTLLDSLPFTPKGVRLLRLSPGSHIKEHRDHDLAFEQGEVRLHIPILTHPGIAFVVDGERIRMQAGECWYINANLPHSVSNPGPGERIHLVVDGPVTEALRGLFERAEKQYSIVATPTGEEEAIISQLRLMNTPASLRLAAEMEAARVKKPDHWYPTALLDEENCQWMDLQDLPFTDPFFHETLKRAQQKPFKVLSTLSFLSEWDLPHVLPSAFIFHVSRCGSTLITQLLGLDPQNITLAEVPFLDQLLRAGQSIRDALRFYGQRRSGNEKKLFVKADSWHVSFYRQLREGYPDVPFFLLYRSPEEVLNSHQKRRGMQSVPGIIEPSVLWGENAPVTNNLDGYMAKVLDNYFCRFLEIAASDKKAYLVNYSEGIQNIVDKIALLTNTEITPGLRTRMQERSGYHAKFPDQKFSEIPAEGFPAEMMTPLRELYARLEALRLP